MTEAKTQANKAAPAHDKSMAKSFLAALDPSAGKFAFQFEGPDQKPNKIFPVTLDQLWRKTNEVINTPAEGFSIFVLPNFPDPRALIAHATNDEQVDRASAAIEACGAKANMIIEDGGRFGICYVCSDISSAQLPSLRKDLNAKL